MRNAFTTFLIASFNLSTVTATPAPTITPAETPAPAPKASASSCDVVLEDFCFKTDEGVYHTVGVPSHTLRPLKELSTCGGGVEGRCDDDELCSELCGYCHDYVAENGMCQCKAKLLSQDKIMKKVYQDLGVPMKKSNPCGPRWHGVTCNEEVEETEVLKIDLNNFGAKDMMKIDAAIPPELGCIATLEYLDLGFNKLKGPIPATLGKLDNLQGLIFHYNALEGVIPKEVCQKTPTIVADEANKCD